MRILFIGNVEVSRACLNKLIQLNLSIVGVCCGEDGDGNSDFFNLTHVCLKYSIPFKRVKDINSLENIAWIRDKKPDLIFCVGWSKILKKDLLEIPSYGVVGYHPAALPKNRGRHPIIWSIALGLKKTASTFFIMDSGIDSGDIISQVEIEIGENDDAAALYEKVKICAVHQFEKISSDFQAGKINRIKQDHTQKTTWRKRGHSDGLIDWRLSASSISRLVRALNKPYVGAHIDTKNGEVKVWKVNIIDNKKYNVEKMLAIEPGKIVDINASGVYVVKCGDGLIELEEIDQTLSYSIGDYL